MMRRLILPALSLAAAATVGCAEKDHVPSYEGNGQYATASAAESMRNEEQKVLDEEQAEMQRVNAQNKGRNRR